jgi:hypothetical protein
MRRTSILTFFSAIALMASLAFAQEPTVDDVRARYGETFESLVSIQVEFESEYTSTQGEFIGRNDYWAEQPPRAIYRSMQTYGWPEDHALRSILPDSGATIIWDDGEWCWHHWYRVPTDDTGMTTQRLEELPSDFINAPALLTGWRLSSIDINDNLLSLFDRAASYVLEEADNGWRILFHEVRAPTGTRNAFAITFDPEHDWLPIEYEMFVNNEDTGVSDNDPGLVKSELFPGYRYSQGWRVTEFSRVADELHGGERWFPTQIETTPNPNHDEEPKVTHVTHVRINPTLSDADLTYELPIGTLVITRPLERGRREEFYVVGGAEGEALLAEREESWRIAASTPPPVLFPIADGMELTDASVEGGVPWVLIMQVVCGLILVIVGGRRFLHARKTQSS